jgi:hypothetical protein
MLAVLASLAVQPALPHHAASCLPSSPVSSCAAYTALGTDTLALRLAPFGCAPASGLERLALPSRCVQSNATAPAGPLSSGQPAAPFPVQHAVRSGISTASNACSARWPSSDSCTACTAAAGQTARLQRPGEPGCAEAHAIVVNPMCLCPPALPPFFHTTVAAVQCTALCLAGS